jgi:hypothetical protein
MEPTSIRPGRRGVAAWTAPRRADHPVTRCDCTSSPMLASDQRWTRHARGG